MAGNLTEHIDDSEAHEQYVRKDLLTKRGSIYVALGNGEIAELQLPSISGYILANINDGVGGLRWVPINVVGGISDCSFTDKGDLLVGLGPCSFQVLPVVNIEGYVLTSDPAEAVGMKWAPASDPTGGLCAVYGPYFQYPCASDYMNLVM